MSTLHVYSVSENSWTELQNAPGSPRGGTSLVSIGSVLLRFGGFSGQELGGSVDVFHPSTNTWSSRKFTHGPGDRSVLTLLAHPVFPATKAVVLFGEKSPSSDGHNAAGTFWSDIWIYDYEVDQWEQAELENVHVLTDGGIGWSAGASDGKHFFIWGGLNENNERIGFGWQVRFSNGS